MQAFEHATPNPPLQEELADIDKFLKIADWVEGNL